MSKISLPIMQKDTDHKPKEQLLEAVYIRSLSRVQQLLEEGADVNTKGFVQSGDLGEKLITPLILASEDGSLDIVRVLLESPLVDIAKVDGYGRTALHAAAEFGHLDVVQKLLSTSGIDVDIKDRCGFTALHLAALNCHAGVARRLLEAKETFMEDCVNNGKRDWEVLSSETAQETSATARQSQENLREHPETPPEPSEATRQPSEAPRESREAVHQPVPGGQTSETAQEPRTAWCLPGYARGPSGNARGLLGTARGPSGTDRESWGTRRRTRGNTQKGAREPPENNREPFEADRDLSPSDQGAPEHAGKPSDAAGESSGTDSEHSNAFDVADGMNKSPEKDEGRSFFPYRGEVEMVEMLLKTGLSSYPDMEVYMECQSEVHPSIGNDVEMECSIKPPDANSKTDETGKRDVFETVKRRDVGKVRELLKRPSTQLHVVDAFGNSLLHLAAEEGHFEIAQMLLKASDGNVNAENACGKTPLLLATERCRVNIVKRLLKREDVDVNIEDERRRSCLSIAVAKGYTGIVEMLLRREDVDVNAKDDGYSVLQIATAKNYAQMIVALLAHKGIRLQDDRMPRERTALHIAIENRNLSLAKALLGHPSVDVNKMGPFDDTPLHMAIEKDSLVMVDVLLQHKKLFVNKTGLHEGRSPLHLAAEKGNLEIVKVLLKHPSIILSISDKSGYKPIDLAVRNNHLTCVEILKGSSYSPEWNIQKKRYTLS